MKPDSAQVLDERKLLEDIENIRRAVVDEYNEKHSACETNQIIKQKLLARRPDLQKVREAIEKVCGPQLAQEVLAILDGDKGESGE